MISVRRLDTIIYYLLLTYALVSGISRGGVNTTIILLTIVSIVRYIYEPFDIKFDPPIKRGMIVLLGTFILATIFSSNIIVSIQFLAMTIFKIVPFFIVLSFVKTEEMIEKIVWFMACSLLLGSLIGIWQGLHGMIRVKSFLGIMDFAGVIGLVFPILLVYGFEYKKSTRWANVFFLTSASIAAIALIYNGTRAVWISVLLSILLYVLLNVARNKKLLIVVAVLLIVSFGIGMTNQYVGKRVSSIVNTTTDSSNVKRINMWKFGWSIFLEDPITGIGPGCFPAANSFAGNVPVEAIRGTTNGDHVHNNFLQMAAEGGIIGLGGFCYLFGTIIYSIWKKMKFEKTRTWATIAFLCTIDFLLHGLFDYTFKLSIIMYMYWFILGLAYVNFPLSKK